MNRFDLRVLADHCLKSYGRDYEHVLKNSILLEKGNDQCLVGWCELLQAVVVCFRGSDKEFMDWRSNFRVVCQDTIFGRMHRGFFRSADKFTDDLKELLKKPEFKDKEIIFTGHSRGGAEANVSALIFRYHTGRKLKLVTFGAPRVFKSKAAKNAANNIVIDRIVNNGDRVTALPYRILGFRHAGKAMKLKGKFINRFPFIGFKDHDLSLYIEKLS